MTRRQGRGGWCPPPWLLAGAAVLAAAALGQPAAQGAVAGPWPEWEQWKRVLLLRDYNTRVVVCGTSLLGLAAGMVGSFTLLRKRALMGDALSHSMLPGIGLAFIVSVMAGGSGKSLPVLLAGAAVSGLLGMVSILAIRNMTRVKEDAAMGIVLSVYFGLGVAILGVIQNMRQGHAAGLETFIYGTTASMVARDAWLIGIAGLAIGLTCLLLFKELQLLCFDETFAGSRGLPVLALDCLLMGLVVVVTLVGLQAVGLILIIALLVIPASAARFWTQHMAHMTVASAILGAVSATVGAAVSALFPRLPSGAMIVVVATIFFAASMGLGTERGVLMRSLRRRRLNRRVDRQHLLRAIYERLEVSGAAPARDAGEMSPPVRITDLLQMRSWSEARLRRQIRRAEREGLLYREDGMAVRLTPQGGRQAAKVVHEHRLWEMYLITQADVAPSQVDRDADAIEHVLDASMIARLEKLLEEGPPRPPVMESPHPIAIPEREPPP